MSPECWRNNWNEYQWLSRYLVLCIWFLAVQICTWSGMKTMAGWLAQFSTLLFSIFIDGFPILVGYIYYPLLNGYVAPQLNMHGAINSLYKHIHQRSHVLVLCLDLPTGLESVSSVDLETHLCNVWSFHNHREGPYLVKSGYYHFHQLVRIVS